jgi:RTX calcium-binding nonapeptide repeat (4 copies)
MPTTATTSYFFKNAYGSNVLSSGLRTGTLADNDLIRGDDAGEAILASNGFALFNGYTEFVFNGPTLNDVTRVTNNGEVLATVTFSDGTSIAGVSALRDVVTGPYGEFNEFFLLDPNALAAAGKTMADVRDVVSTGNTDHALNWSDFGISGTPVAPVLPPPPPPPPVLNRIEGTAGRDVLSGTAGNDLIIGNGGRDTLSGRGGADTFVFGREAGNGVRDVATITDYDAFTDTILLTNNAQIARTVESGADVIIVLAGADGDRIILKNQPDSGPLYKVVFDADFFG